MAGLGCWLGVRSAIGWLPTLFGWSSHRAGWDTSILGWEACGLEEAIQTYRKWMRGDICLVCSAGGLASFEFVLQCVVNRSGVAAGGAEVADCQV